MSTKTGSAWMGSSFPGGVTVPRGPWHYDGEIDLGFGGALRMAATIVTRDPIFGWFAYGGVLEERGDTLAINPRDGLRRRFDVVIPDRGLPFRESIARMKVELERDGFSSQGMITMDKALGRVAFTLENRTGNTHTTGVRLSLPINTGYALLVDGRAIQLAKTDNADYPYRGEISVNGAEVRVELVRR